jgi:uncharacterized membrane protein YeaQ/YmgE (transglycosylase-associated protein family)
VETVLPAQFQSWLEFMLLWIGFGTCVGLLAKALMPGRDPGGALTTLLMGIVGVVIGCGVYVLIYGERIKPISAPGLVWGTLGAFTILVFYRLLGGFFIDEGSHPLGHRHAYRRPHRRRSRRRVYGYVDGYDE